MVARSTTQLNDFMGHDTELRKLRATSQENSVKIQKLNEKIRILMAQIDRQLSKGLGTKRDESSKPKA